MANAVTHILAPTDFGDVSNAAASYAARLAIALGVPLTIQHVVLDPLAGGWAVETTQLPALLERMTREAREKLDTKLQTVLTDEERAVLTVETAVGMGRPADEIIEYADNHGIDLIVMGTHGRGGVEKMWLGSVTEKVLRKARCPVLVLHGGA
jgi:nucleotide-binding universal stress UspA family protein